MRSVVRVHLSPCTRGISSVGRAPALQAGGHEFESRILHLIIISAADMADGQPGQTCLAEDVRTDIGGYSENIRERKTLF